MHWFKRDVLAIEEIARNTTNHSTNHNAIAAELIDIYTALRALDGELNFDHELSSDSRVAIEFSLEWNESSTGDYRATIVHTLSARDNDYHAYAIDSNALFAESSVDDLISFEEARAMFRAEWRAWNLAAQEELNVSVKLLENGYQYESDVRFIFMQKFGYMADILQTALDNMHNVRREHVGSFHTTPDWRPLFD